jgi:tetratricopeptide (TPR) repeat protein
MAALGLITLAALAVRLWGLGRASLWTDEIGQSWAVLAPSLGECLAQVKWQTAMTPLDEVLGWLWAHATGAHAEFSLRLYAAIIGTLTVPAMWLWARALGGRAAGLLAAGLAALSGFDLMYSQTLRPYALFALLCAVMLWAFMRMMERPAAWRPVLIFAATVLLGLHTHLFTVFLVAAFAFAMICDALAVTWRAGLGGLWHERGPLWGRLAACAAVVGLLFLPWFLYDTRFEIGGGTQEFHVVRHYTWAHWVEILFQLSGRSLWTLAALTVGVSAAAVISLRRGKVVPAALALSIPLLMALQISLIASRSYWLLPRQFMHIWALGLGLAAAGLAWLGEALWRISRGRRATRIVSGLGITAGLCLLAWWHVPGIRSVQEFGTLEDWRGASSVMRRLMGNSTRDIAVAHHFDQYLRFHWPEIDARLWPPGGITRGQIEEERARGRRVYIFLASHFLAEHYAWQMHEIEGLPQIRLDLWSTAELVCIPEETERPEESMLDWMLFRLTPERHDSAYLLASLARECVVHRHGLRQVDGLLDRLLATDQPAPEIMTGLVQELLKAGANDRAARMLREQERLWRLRVATTFFNRAGELASLAVCERALGRSEASRHLLRRALRWALWVPGQDVTQFQLRLAQDLLHDDPSDEEGLGLLRSALASAPDHPQLWVTLAENLRTRGEWEALGDLVLRAKAECPAAVTSLGPAAMETLMWLDASPEVSAEQRSRRLEGLASFLGSADGPTAVAEAVLWQHRGDWEASLQAGRRAAAADPRSGVAQGLIASAAEHLGRDAEASDAWITAVCLISGPDAPGLWEEAQAALQRRGVTLAQALAQGHADATQCEAVARWLEGQGQSSGAVAVREVARGITGPHP